MNKTSKRNINKKCSTGSAGAGAGTGAGAGAGVNCGKGNGQDQDPVDLKLERKLELVNGFSNDSSITGTKFKKKGLENGKHLLAPQVRAADGFRENDIINNFTGTLAKAKATTNTNAYTNSAGAGASAGASAGAGAGGDSNNSLWIRSSDSEAEEEFDHIDALDKGKFSETKRKSKSKCNSHSEHQHKYHSNENIPKTLGDNRAVGVVVDASSTSQIERTEPEELVDSHTCTADPETNGCREPDHLIRNLEDLSIQTAPARTRTAEEKGEEEEEEQSVGGSDLPGPVPPQAQIEYVQYENELQMPMIMRIIQKDLSEPYSIYTYRYFIHNWPKLCFLAMCEGNCVGAIVCKLDFYRKVIRRGYIAMLAVDKNYRKRGLGSTLVRRAIQEMVRGEADEVVLETEITNRPALQLYEGLGFVRDKRLFRYYLNGVDALRLKLWLR